MPLFQNLDERFIWQVHTWNFSLISSGGLVWQNDKGYVEHFSLTVLPFCSSHSFWRGERATVIIFFRIVLQFSSSVYQYAFWQTNLQSKMWLTTSTVSLLLNGFSDRLLNCLVLVFIKSSWFLCKVLQLLKALSRIQPNMAPGKLCSRNVLPFIRELQIHLFKAINSVLILKAKEIEQNHKNKCK